MFLAGGSSHPNDGSQATSLCCSPFSQGKQMGKVRRLLIVFLYAAWPRNDLSFLLIFYCHELVFCHLLDTRGFGLENIVPDREVSLYIMEDRPWIFCRRHKLFVEKTHKDGGLQPKKCEERNNWKSQGWISRANQHLRDWLRKITLGKRLGIINQNAKSKMLWKETVLRKKKSRVKCRRCVR